jgi:hypothetical protein
VIAAESERTCFWPPLGMVYMGVYVYTYGTLDEELPMAELYEKMVRKQFLVSPATVKRLQRIAAKRGTSASEIVRLAIDSFDVNAAEAMDSPELMELVATRLKEAIESTRHAHRTVSRTLKLLSEGGD